MQKFIKFLSASYAISFFLITSPPIFAEEYGDSLIARGGGHGGGGGVGGVERVGRPGAGGGGAGVGAVGRDADEWSGAVVVCPRGFEGGAGGEGALFRVWGHELDLEVQGVVRFGGWGPDDDERLDRRDRRRR